MTVVVYSFGGAAKVSYVVLAATRNGVFLIGSVLEAP